MGLVESGLHRTRARAAAGSSKQCDPVWHTRWRSYRPGMIRLRSIRGPRPPRAKCQRNATNRELFGCRQSLRSHQDRLHSSEVVPEMAAPVPRSSGVQTRSRPERHRHARPRWVRGSERGALEVETALGRRVPVAAVSAYAHAEDRQRAIAAGFDHYLAKPVDPAALASTVKTLVSIGNRHLAEPH
jgi:hypothetical protein